MRNLLMYFTAIFIIFLVSACNSEDKSNTKSDDKSDGVHYTIKGDSERKVKQPF